MTSAVYDNAVVAAIAITFNLWHGSMRKVKSWHSSGCATFALIDGTARHCCTELQAKPLVDVGRLNIALLPGAFVDVEKQNGVWGAVISYVIVREFELMFPRIETLEYFENRTRQKVKKLTFINYLLFGIYYV